MLAPGISARMARGDDHGGFFQSVSVSRARGEQSIFLRLRDTFSTRFIAAVRDVMGAQRMLRRRSWCRRHGRIGQVDDHYERQRDHGRAFDNECVVLGRCQRDHPPPTRPARARPGATRPVSARVMTVFTASARRGPVVWHGVHAGFAPPVPAMSMVRLVATVSIPATGRVTPAVWLDNCTNAWSMTKAASNTPNPQHVRAVFVGMPSDAAPATTLAHSNTQPFAKPVWCGRARPTRAAASIGGQRRHAPRVRALIAKVARDARLDVT